MTNSQIIEVLREALSLIENGFSVKAASILSRTITQLENAGEVDIEAGAKALFNLKCKDMGVELDWKYNYGEFMSLARACAEAWKLKGRE